MNQYVINNPRRVNNPTRQFGGRSALYSLLIGFSLLLSACNREADDAVTPQPTTNEHGLVNRWILENMQELYYWNDKLPTNPDTTLAPDAFFESLLYTYDATTNPNGDRFSWIEESADELEASLNGESTTTGMEYGLFLRSAGSDAIIAQVFYVLPGSPAERAGIKRGDIISRVNGQLLNRANYASLLFSGTTFAFGLASVSGSTVVDTDVTKTVTATVFQANPIFLDSVYTVGTKRVGYLVYNQFVPGANGSEADEYDAELDAIFGRFKAQGVNELVLDLRYNPGGYTSSSTNLASLIGKGVSSSQVFFREEWNATITPYLRRQYGNSFFVENFKAKAQNIGSNLSRVFVLTTDYTASASELIINGLRPYMTVMTIGTTTYGKNVGSITITDDTGQIKWGMQPIVFKTYNSAGQSDYAAGFVPNVEVEEPLSLRPLGDTNEALLNEALAHISGATSGRRAATVGNTLPALGSSIQRKAGGGWMVKALKPLNL